jgi:ATP-dependent DNA helicase RecQ
MDSFRDKQTVLREVFGYDRFRPGQETVVDALIDGRNVLAVMPTGAGKSICYQVPALVRGGLAVVVSPLVALMQDQVAALQLAGVPAEAIHSGQDRPTNVAIWRRVAAGDVPILYLAPERLMTERMLAALSRLDVRLFAIDEAHCISQWGPAFRPEYEALSQLKDIFPGVPIAAMTATADAATRDDIAAKLFAGNAERVVTGFNRPNITLAVEPKRDMKRQLLEFLKRHEGESGIVYCLSRRKTDETAAFLNAEGIPAVAYHAGMEKQDRSASHERFINDPATVVVATIAFGMGIDKPDVRFVFHTDIPGSVEAYYQEIGRAGRDGEPSEVCMLYGLDDIRMRRMFIDQEDSDDERKRREHQRLDALIAYCEAPECRRRALLAYFGEESGSCGNCDVCLNPVALEDGTEEARLALSTVALTGQRFGAAHIVEILRGAKTERLAEFGHDDLKTWGKGAMHSKEAWRSIIRQLVAAGYLTIDIQAYGGLRLTSQARPLMEGDGTFRYRPDISKPKGKSAAARKTAAIAQDLSADENDMLAKLKELRRRLASDKGVPPYLIFADRSLVDMAVKKPVNREEFANVHGVGEAKLRDLADPFLAAING